MISSETGRRLRGLTTDLASSRRTSDKLQRILQTFSIQPHTYCKQHTVASQSVARSTTNCCYTVSQKKRANFETVQLKIIRIVFDDIWQKYSKCPRIESACFSFCVGLVFINLSSFKPDTENNANFESYASHFLSTWHYSLSKFAHFCLDTVYYNTMVSI